MLICVQPFGHTYIFKSVSEYLLLLSHLKFKENIWLIYKGEILVSVSRNFDALRPRHNDCLYTDTFKLIFLHLNLHFFLIKISLQIVPKGPMNK